MKLSAGKATAPGAKQIFRGPDGDVVGLREEPTPAGSEPVLEPVMRDGVRLSAPEPLERIRSRFDADLVAQPEEARRLRGPISRSVHLSTAATNLAKSVQSHLARRRETV